MKSKKKNLFKIEELEPRLELSDWSGDGNDTNGQCNGNDNTLNGSCGDNMCETTNTTCGAQQLT